MSGKTHSNRTRRAAGRRSRDLTVVARAAAFVLLFASAAVVVVGLVAPASQPASCSWTTVVVQPNGTLWQIAEAHPLPGFSTAEAVDVIQQENGLPDAIVHVGQSLRVPAPSTPADVAVAQR